MKEYKLVYLNKGIKWTTEADIAQAEEEINEWVSNGWTLQQIATPSNAGTLIGVFYRERKETDF